MAGVSSPSVAANGQNLQLEDLQFRSYRQNAVDGSMALAQTTVGDWGYNALVASATTLVKTGPGQLGAILVGTATGNLTIYDSLTAAGTVIWNTAALAVGALVFNVSFSVGLTCVLSGAGAATALYR